jgi:uncharacterized protein DUF5681
VAKSSTSFAPGRSGNPTGRRLGSKNTAPSVREIVNAVMTDHVDDVKEAYRKAAVSSKSVLQALELKARVNREVGNGQHLQLEQDPDGTVRVTLTWPESAA